MYVCAAFTSQVWLTSKDGRGWTRDIDQQGSTATCCQASSGGNTSCCPQLRLYSLGCNVYLPGFGPGEASFGEGEASFGEGDARVLTAGWRAQALQPGRA